MWSHNPLKSGERWVIHEKRKRAMRKESTVPFYSCSGKKNHEQRICGCYCFCENATLIDIEIV